MSHTNLIPSVALMVLATAVTAQDGFSAVDTQSVAQAGRFARSQPKGWQFSPVAIQQSTQLPKSSISIESNLVALDVLVTDEDGNVLGGLKKDNFRVLDNGQPQIITQFELTDDAIAIVVLRASLRLLCL